VTFTFELDLGRIRFAESGFEIRFGVSVHSVREPESGLANPAKPVLTWIHWRNRTCLAVRWRLRKQIALPTTPTKPDHSICQRIQIQKLLSTHTHTHTHRHLTDYSTWTTKVFVEDASLAMRLSVVTASLSAVVAAVRRPFHSLCTHKSS